MGRVRTQGRLPSPTARAVTQWPTTWISGTEPSHWKHPACGVLQGLEGYCIGVRGSEMTAGGSKKQKQTRPLGRPAWPCASHPRVQRRASGRAKQNTPGVQPPQYVQLPSISQDAEGRPVYPVAHWTKHTLPAL